MKFLALGHQLLTFGHELFRGFLLHVILLSNASGGALVLSNGLGDKRRYERSA
jgi:hypothetical protein